MLSPETFAYTARSLSARPTTAEISSQPCGLAGVPTHLPHVLHPGCVFWIDMRSPLTRLPHPQGFSWQLPLPLANNQALVGVELRAQAIYGTASIRVSNAIQMTVGTQEDNPARPPSFARLPSCQRYDSDDPALTLVRIGG